MAAGSHSYVIVGAGSAGCVLANRLSADPACRVALLEAGGPDRAREIHIPAGFIKLLMTEYDWNYRTTKQPQLSDRELYWPRGKTLGGSSSINGQAWTRGHRADYDGWAESCPGWSYDEVLPYFQRAEHRVGGNAGGVYGTSGPQFISELRDPNPTTSAFLAACAELGPRRLGELNEPDKHGVCADAGHPTPWAAAQRRGCVPTPSQAAAQLDRPHRGSRPADSVRRDPCHRRGIPGCGRRDPALGPRGGVITTATLRDATGWDALVTELGQPGLVRHGLRHTALTWMADAGVDLHILQRVAGHQDPAVTARYLHPDVQAIVDAGTAFSAWWSVVGPERPPLGVIEGGKNVG